jgi:hypothetical protein
MSCLLEKPGGSVIQYRICFHRTPHTITQLPWIVWNSANRYDQDEWDICHASKWYIHFGGGSVRFTQKYWHPVRVHKGSMLSRNTNGKPDSGFSVQGRWNHGIDESSHGENFKRDEVQRTPITFAVNFRRNCARIPRNDTPMSRNRPSHEILRTWTTICGSFWSQELRWSRYCAPSWYARFHYSPSRWRWCRLNSRDDAIFLISINPPNLAW